MKTKSNGKHVSVLITGAASGIGLALSRECLLNGFHVTAVIRNINQKDRLPAVSSGSLTVETADLSDKRQVESLIGRICLSTFDYIVHNAGTAKVGPFDKMEESDIDDIIRTNLLTPMYMTRALLPQALNNNTKFVFISSLSARLPAGGYISYGVSKAGLSKFAQDLRVEYPHLEVLCVEPGAVDTPMHQKAGNTAANKKFFKDPSIIGKRLYNAMLTKNGIVTLDASWAVARKMALWTDGLFTKLAMRRTS